jgi:cytoskeletal protein RodZ
MWNRWFVLVVVFLVGLLALTSCSAAPQPSPASSSPTPSSSAPSPTPSATAQPTPSQTSQPSPSSTAEGSLIVALYPNAKVINTSTSHTTDSSGVVSTVTSVLMETTDPYEQVKAYYQNSRPAGFLATIDEEKTAEDGNRTYTSYLVKSENQTMIILIVTEDKTVGKVTIDQAQRKPD